MKVGVYNYKSSRGAEVGAIEVVSFRLLRLHAHLCDGFITSSFECLSLLLENRSEYAVVGSGTS